MIPGVSLCILLKLFQDIYLGSNPEWGLICYKASITAQGLPEPSSLRGSTLGTREAAEHKGCKLIDGCSLELCSATPSVACHRNEVNSIT